MIITATVCHGQFIFFNQKTHNNTQVAENKTQIVGAVWWAEFFKFSPGRELFFYTYEIW